MQDEVKQDGMQDGPQPGTKFGWILTPTGGCTKVEPANGTDFTLPELQDIVGGYIEIAYVPGGSLIIVLNEEGKLKGLATNYMATTLYGNPNDFIVGTVLVCGTEMVK